MDKFEKLMELGGRLGYKGEELESWITKMITEDDEREQRLFERETKREAEETKRKAEEFEREAKRKAEEVERENERLKEIRKHEEKIEELKLEQLKLSQGTMTEMKSCRSKDDTIKMKYFNPKEEKIESLNVWLHKIRLRKKSGQRLYCPK